MDDTSILTSIANEMQTGVVAVDSSGTVLFANPFFHKSFSLKKSIKGRKLFSALGKDNRFALAVEEALKKGVKGAKAQDAIEIAEKRRIFKLRIVPVKDKKKFNLVMFLRDVTEEKQVEAIKKDFVANVSHELRTPLASIKGCAETLLDGGSEDRDTLKEFLRIIDKNSTRMSRLIEDLLVLSRLESQQMPMVLEPIDLSELISSTVDVIGKQARDKGIVINKKLDKSLSRVIGDRVRLEQVLVNLLDNAIKYTPSGGKVNVALSFDSGLARVDVTDTGIGIPTSDMPRIFERFYRVDKARSREMGGTGLGLAIVKHIIQSLNGRVWVESEPQKGSTFSFTLKAA